ncbi:uncharacterized protein F4812DRAFT_456073 [Daldinia caldariorum]|uniref:uncharacterized protein n=1 Tax=Daldinia caldariorum TaxID=326644 RepID=UPI002008729F|nr:uncharacterized protein F4812DRAFT_456073 [Daldinia caldariorum]KAI1471970.1 hypothetical protein F4812DRAFT_456073 [Daldinia caldariorum]
MATKSIQASTERPKAATLAPSDPSPLSNLSAVSFETCKYTECIDFSTKALSILQTGPENNTLKQKLLFRQVKAHLHQSSLDDAENVLNQLVPGEEAADLEDTIEELREIDNSPPRQELLPELEKSAENDPVLSMMFGGVSDARHVFHTILEYSLKKKGSQKLHLTMVDHKPIVVARDLVFFSLLLEAAGNKESKDVALLSLSYAYCAQIIPQFAWDKLQETVTKLLDRLEKTQQPIEMGYLPNKQMDSVVAILKSWQGNLTTLYITLEIHRHLVEHGAKAHPRAAETLSKFSIDRRTFEDFSVIFPPQDMLPSLEPGVSTLFGDYQAGKQGGRQRLSDYLNKHWKVNFTLLDPVVHKRLEELALDVMEVHPCSVVITTLKVLHGIRLRGGASHCLKHLKDFFEKVSQHLVQLRGRLILEMNTGDVAEVLERMRYDILDRPDQKGGAGDPGSTTTIDWPLQYHQIHLNDIPDYTGGSLTSFLYGPPVLKKGVGTGFSSCSLTFWDGINHFNAETLLMYDRKMIEKHFQVKQSKEPPKHDTVIFRYYRWEKSEDGPQPLGKLMSRESFFKWMFAHYLKICTPFRRPPNECCFQAPLNLTAFLRLLVRMGELGYPSHWLSQIIKSLSQALAEFTTLVAQWRSLLPYTVVVPSETLLPPEDIAEYTVNIPHSWAPYLDCPEFVLVFWNGLKYPLPPSDLSAVLLDDEERALNASAFMQEMREDGMNVVTTVDYVHDTHTATFWLRCDVMRTMLRWNWAVFIGRTDLWTCHTPPRSLNGLLQRKRTWKGCVTA